MPFTFAHPVAILPFARWARSKPVLSALVIGSMIPDFGYFVPGNYVHAHTHTFDSLFWFSLPAGMLVWGVFHLLGRPFTVSRLFQHGMTLFGLVVLVLVIRRWSMRKKGSGNTT